MKNQKTIKARDPNWKDMEALRKSGAAGSHRDKKKEMKLGKVKHKGKTMDESIYTNPAGGELSKLGRILMDKSITVKDDALSNVLGRVGDELTRYGEAGGATSIDELCKRARCNKEQLMKMMKWAQQQKDTSLDKVKDPDPKPEDDEDDDKKESFASETSIGHVDDERHMIRKELYQAAKYAKELFTMLDDLPEDSDFPHWWQSKVTKSLQMLSKAKHYLENELAVPEATQESVCSECGKARFVALPEEMQKQYESVNEEKQKGVDGKVCWKGYKRMGTKMKGGKRVDNCVKIKK
tara:strand:- start:44 stop:928 length:885 start_codon:yes stop_codon:yes gene_type:complete